MKTYPAYCTNDDDRAAYDTARRGKFDKYVTSPADLLAIRQGCTSDLAAAQRVETFLALLPHTLCHQHDAGSELCAGRAAPNSGRRLA